ncbi:hypothetical protein CBS101457_004581 [Exobasidium rhododendri]|nr:hypothetical protein CBS101457_004581 [Exobasidium rhododendri]
MPSDKPSGKVVALAASTETDFLGSHIGSLLSLEQESSNERSRRYHSLHFPVTNDSVAYAESVSSLNEARKQRSISRQACHTEDNDGEISSKNRTGATSAIVYHKRPPLFTTPSSSGVYGSFFKKTQSTLATSAPVYSPNLESGEEDDPKEGDMAYFDLKSNSSANSPLSSPSSSIIDAGYSTMYTRFGRSPSQKRSDVEEDDSMSRTTSLDGVLAEVTASTKIDYKRENERVAAISPSFDDYTIASKARSTRSAPAPIMNDFDDPDLDSEEEGGDGSWNTAKGRPSPLESETETNEVTKTDRSSLDQATWNLFRDGGAIEPPEADSLPIVMLEESKGQSELTSSNGADTIGRLSDEISEEKSRVRNSLKPIGKGGRLFEFVVQAATSRNSSNVDSDDSRFNVLSPKTPLDNDDPTRQHHALFEYLDEPWLRDSPTASQTKDLLPLTL